MCKRRPRSDCTRFFELSQVCVLRELRLPQFEKNIGKTILPEFGRDHVARGGSGLKPSPARARRGALLIPGRNVSW